MCPLIGKDIKNKKMSDKRQQTDLKSLMINEDFVKN